MNKGMELDTIFASATKKQLGETLDKAYEALDRKGYSLLYV